MDVTEETRTSEDMDNQIIQKSEDMQDYGEWKLGPGGTMRTHQTKYDQLICVWKPQF